MMPYRHTVGVRRTLMVSAITVFVLAIWIMLWTPGDVDGKVCVTLGWVLLIASAVMGSEAVGRESDGSRISRADHDR